VSSFRPGYPAGVLSIARMRNHLPLFVFIFFVLIVVMLIGVACACATDHPMQAVDRAISAIPAALPVIDLWPFIVLLLAPPLLWLAVPVRAPARASPPLLERFLF
jgi:hypothetical protein